MFILSILLIAFGLLIALLGVKLFRVLLPVNGLVTGAMAGFIGTQAVFGTGVVGTTIALLVAVILGLLLALLSYAFFEIAVTIYIAMLGAAAFAFLGEAIGLNENGFLVFMLALAGAVLAGAAAVYGRLSLALVMAFTSFSGVAYVLAGSFLLVGGLSIDELNQNGVGGSVVAIVDQSFLWLLVWVGASLVAWQLQAKSLFDEYLTSSFEYSENKR